MADENDVRIMRDWLQKQPHLPQNIDDRLLSRFILCCGGSLERTKTSMELFFTLRSDNPDIFRNRDPASQQIQNSFNMLEVLPLKHVTPEGYTCSLFRIADLDLEKFNFQEIIKLVFMVGDMQIRTDLDIVPGLVCIFDMAGWSINHLVKIPLMSLKKCIQYAQDAQPVKVKQIHMINATSFMDKLLAVIKPFLSAESANMFHIHPVGSDSLFQSIPQAVLPEEYGGHSGSIKDIKAYWKLKIDEDREWFLRDEWMADESKRVGKRNTLVRMGMDGSFRSLSID